MALSRRAIAAALAGLALTGAVTPPADAYWRATGSATGTVPTAAGAPKVITLTLSKQGNKITASGNAGTGGAYGTPVTVKVVLCKVNTWPCPAVSIAADLTATATAGTYTVQSPNLSNNTTVYGRASQTQTSGWTDHSVVPGSVTI